MKAAGSPPRWAEFILERLLISKDRRTVTGDLREEYVEAILPRMNRIRADLWYVRQVLSLAPSCASARINVHKVLRLVSLCTFVCACWLAGVESLLRHSGFVMRLGIDAAIGLVALAAILVRPLHLGIRAERCLWTGAIALIGQGTEALIRNARSTHFEGFVLVISLLLMLQGILMFFSLGRGIDTPRNAGRGIGSLE